MTAGDPATAAVPGYDTLLTVLRLASRAPSVHNTQPWHWILDGTRLELHTDSDRQLFAADPHGRQQIISCGAVLHHARTLFAAHGWHTDIVRLPAPDRPGYLAVIEFRPWPDPPAGIGLRAMAIDRRYTDRLPMLPPTGWTTLVPALRQLVTPHDLELDVLGDEIRPRLAQVSDSAAAARHYDMMYQHELQWWVGHSEMPEGVPPTALASDAEFARVDVGRSFPRPPHSARRPEIHDRSALIVLSSYTDSVVQWLRTGEALSAVLLECTAAGLATCPLTHITELPAGRQTVASLLPQATLPQVLIRVGSAPDDKEQPPTPRRPLTEIFEVRH
jgi:nitroreductase